MLGYSLESAWHGTRRHPLMSAFMVLAVALGISAPFSAIALVERLGGDPLPGLSYTIFHPQIEPRPAEVIARDPAMPADLTLQDAEALYQLPTSPAAAMMSANRLPAKRGGDDSPLRMTHTRATTWRFFSLFGLHFLAGRGWTSADDNDRAPVVVLSRVANERIFGGKNSVGKEMQIATRTFRVIGIVDDFNPKPHFYDLGSGPFANAEDLYMPFRTWMDLPQDYGFGPTHCWPASGQSGEHPTSPNCTWVQYWVSLTEPDAVARFRENLQAYVSSQVASGRFQVNATPMLSDVRRWVEVNHVVPPTVRMQAVIGAGVFLICMISAIGLLVAKFSRYGSELAIRRALGATRKDIFLQCLFEAGIAGLAGGILSVPLTWLGFRMIQRQSPTLMEGIHVDAAALSQSVAVAVIVMFAVGLYPALRSSRVAPAQLIKTL
ncbi:putative ABC transport system permease protein [Luteibacter jiangsuensis]|uniref:ABC transport system permease protein n=1 Tax=Luteibacter jiangsuensis TaxID=637577 RepID=A0ABT9SWA0_9GAMM|nr:ABC transporter permease [Luteibacter jiangsuensis]MDQ0008257.1 putative ABC transport system permease protein [Luteibacter jiangsuensis]